MVAKLLLLRLFFISNLVWSKVPGNWKMLYELQLTLHTLILTLIGYRATSTPKPAIMRSRTNLDLPTLVMMFALHLAKVARPGATKNDCSV